MVSKLPKLELLLFTIFVISTFVLVWHHEPFRDEAQKWLIARDCNISQIIGMAGYEGHPTLWTFMLVPLAKFGWPIFSMQLLCWAIMCAAIYIFITKSPFHIAIKFAFCCSYFIMYEYTVIARNYCLVILGLMLFAHFFKTRKSNIFPFALSLLLLSQSQVLMLGILLGAIFIQVVQFRDFNGKQHFLFFSILGVGLVLLLWQVQRPLDSVFRIDIENFTFQNFFIGLNSFSQILVYLLNPIPVRWYFIFFTILPLFYFFKFNSLYILLYFIFILPLFVVHSFVYSFNAWHSFLPFIFLILLIWIILDEHKIKKVQKQKSIFYGNILLFFILFVSDFYNLRFFGNEIKRPFSASKEMAQIIVKNKYYLTHQLVGESDFGISPILVYLPSIQVYHPSFDAMGTFARWRFNNKLPQTSSSAHLPLDELINRCHLFLDPQKPKLLIVQKVCFDKNLLIENNLKIIDSTSSTVFGAKEESYYLIKM